MIFVRIFLFLAATRFATSGKESCPLNSLTIYPYIVKIWHVKNQTTFGHGSIISYWAVLTGCTNFLQPKYDPAKHPKDYELIGNKVIEIKPIQKVCHQTRGVHTYIKHPKCVAPISHVFDFGIFILQDPFNVDGSYNYPTMAIMNDVFHMSQDIKFIDVTKKAGCEFPLLYYKDHKNMTFRTTWQVHTIPFHQECLALFCEYEPYDLSQTNACRERYGLRQNLTELCMKPEQTLIDGHVEFNRTGVNWYAGGPLVCNGTSYGMTTMVKWRHVHSGHDNVREDFFFVVTLLRGYEWIIENKIRYGANWIRPFFIEQQDLERERLTTPSRKPRNDPTLFPPKKRKILEFVWQREFKKGEKSRSGLNDQEQPHSSNVILAPFMPILGLLGFAANLLM